MGKIKCIICEELKESSIEHIIPKSLGNKNLITTLVCKECNSKMGEKIDSPFVNNILIELQRNDLGLKGYKGKVPNPWENGKDSEGNRIRVDDNFKPKLTPNLVDNNTGFLILAGSKEEIYEHGTNKLKRMGASETELNNFKNKVKNTELKDIQAEIHYEFKMFFNDLIPGFLKIAYEVMYELAGEQYVNDKIGKKIQSILNQVINNESVEYEELIFSPSFKSPEDKEVLKRLPNGHMVIPNKDNHNQIFLTIILFNGLLECTILISREAQKYLDLDLESRWVEI